MTHASENISLDTSPPQLTVTPRPARWFDLTLKYAYEARDEESGLAEISLRPGAGAMLSPDDENAAGIVSYPRLPGRRTLVWEALDQAGNRREVSIIQEVKLPLVLHQPASLVIIPLIVIAISAIIFLLYHRLHPHGKNHL